MDTMPTERGDKDVSVLNFKPTVWSKVILAALKKSLVFGSSALTNDDYEGEISGPGNSVRITQFGDPTISAYTPGSPIAYQALQDSAQDLLIDQAFSFSFEIDDVDRRQAAGDMQAYLEDRAAYALANVADQFIAGLYTGCASANQLNQSLSSSANYLLPQPFSSATSHPADFYTQVLIPLGVLLDQANIPKNNRYCVMPPWAEALVRQTLGFVAVTDMQGDPSQVFTTGMIGRVAGFDIYTSNNCVEFDTTYSTNGAQGAYVVQAGHPMAITYAEQITQTEALRLQTTFADAVRGLHVYGAKLVRPDAIAVAGVARPAGI